MKNKDEIEEFAKDIYCCDFQNIEMDSFVLATRLKALGYSKHSPAKTIETMNQVMKQPNFEEIYDAVHNRKPINIFGVEYVHSPAKQVIPSCQVFSKCMGKGCDLCHPNYIQPAKQELDEKKVTEFLYSSFDASLVDRLVEEKLIKNLCSAFTPKPVRMPTEKTLEDLIYKLNQDNWDKGLGNRKSPIEMDKVIAQAIRKLLEEQNDDQKG